MRVLHLVNYVNATGNGITNVTVDLASGQWRLGHEVCVASAGGAYEELLVEQRVQTARVDFSRRDPVSLGWARHKLKGIVSGFNPDVVHTHTLTPTVLASSLHSGPPVVATVHNEYQRGVKLMGLADAVVGVSEAVTQSMVARGIAVHRMHTVRNGTIGSPRRVQRSDLVAVDLQHPAIVAVGAVSERKGSDVLLDAFGSVLQELPEAHLYFVGNQDWPRFDQLVRSRTWSSQVHLEGFRSQPQAYLHEADVFAIPSRREPFPLAMLEALEAGCAIVGSDVDGIPEGLAHGAAGLLSPAGDSAGLAANLVSLLREPERARQLGVSARQHSREFTVERMSGEYVELYQTLGR